MCAACMDNKIKGFQKFVHKFLRSKSPSSNHNEIGNLETDAIAFIQPNKISSLQLLPSQIEQNASLPMDLMSVPNLALHSQQLINGGGGNVNNNFHISGSDAVHIGNNIHFIQNSSNNQVTNKSREKVIKPSATIKNGINVEKPKRLIDEQRRIVEKLKESNTEITEQIINLASDNISPKNANFIYRYLGLSDAKIDTIDKDNFTFYGSREVIYKMLLHWKQSADYPTIGQLITALYKNNNYQCINELIKHFIEAETLSEYIKDQS